MRMNHPGDQTNFQATSCMATLQQAFEWIAKDIPQAQLAGDGACAFARVHTDSRTAEPGDLFVALVGERFDAHDFLPQVQAAGVQAALVRTGTVVPQGMAAIAVPDTLQGMTALARHWRAQKAITLMAVTGSNGKTTVTQMLAAILRAQHGDDALATSGNLNNEIGVPMMALRLRPTHRAAVLELGMNHPGEIARLAATAQPTVALINNAQREHLEFMQTVEAVARENGSVFRFLPPEGVAVFPGDDVYTPLWRELAGQRRVVEFGGADCAVHLRKARWGDAGWEAEISTPSGVLPVQLRILGRHNLRNALAAVATAQAAGLSDQAIVQGLAAFGPVKGRSAFHVLPGTGGQSHYLVDDTYNANPDSVRAAIDVLAELPAPRALVLGDMGEVGEQGPAFHAEAGEYAKAKGVAQLLALGDASAAAVAAFGSGARHFDNMPALQDAMRETMQTHRSVLVKGSRFMGMERAAQSALQAMQPVGAASAQAQGGTA